MLSRLENLADWRARGLPCTEARQRLAVRRAALGFSVWTISARRD